ncbi:tRNA-binding protein [Patescibacteria group bacterium]|nr:tRNA-binding protein [Patescibacteria group bacterium]
MIKPPIDFADFTKVDIRIGRVVRVEDFPQAKKPAYKLWIDFGSEIGVKTSSAQIVKNHTKDELLNKLVACVVNFLEKQVGPFTSQVLTLGPDDGTEEPSNWVVLTPIKEVPLGSVVK